jgi:hypothetical protein
MTQQQASTSTLVLKGVLNDDEFIDLSTGESINFIRHKNRVYNSGRVYARFEVINSIFFILDETVPVEDEDLLTTL